MEIQCEYQAADVSPDVLHLDTGNREKQEAKLHKGTFEQLLILFTHSTVCQRIHL